MSERPRWIADFGDEHTLRPSWASRSDKWFAWYPVQTGALGTGGWRWMQWMWRNRCMGATIYQSWDNSYGVDM